eukprot:1157298-Pelagomonas_calceolata.AAC.7
MTSHSCYIGTIEKEVWDAFCPSKKAFLNAALNAFPLGSRKGLVFRTDQSFSMNMNFWSKDS